MQKKIWLGIIMSTFLMFLLNSGIFAAEVAYSDFANVLVIQLNMSSERPGNYDMLPASERFNIDANILANKGITAFVGRDYNDVVSSGEAAEVVYMLMTVPAPDVTQVEKLNYLVQKEIMPPTQPTTTLSVDEMEAIFSNSYVTERLDLSENFTTYVPPKEKLLSTTSPTGIDQEVILVEPDITEPYTTPASPTI